MGLKWNEAHAGPGPSIPTIRSAMFWSLGSWHVGFLRLSEQTTNQRAGRSCFCTTVKSLKNTTPELIPSASHASSTSTGCLRNKAGSSVARSRIGWPQRSSSAKEITRRSTWINFTVGAKSPLGAWSLTRSYRRAHGMRPPWRPAPHAMRCVAFVVARTRKLFARFDRPDIMRCGTLRWDSACSTAFRSQRSTHALWGAKRS